MQLVFGKKDSVIIYADLREASSRIPSILEKSCTVRKKQLKVADYILSRNVAVERKTSQDFINSIMDSRIFHQLSRMKESFPSSLLIIEGEHILDTDINIHQNALLGALASISVSLSVPIIWTRDQRDTAAFLLITAKREQSEKKNNIALRGKKKFLSVNQKQLFLISGLENISTKTAEKLLIHFRTPAKLFSASEGELVKVPGIGREKARRIRKLLERKFDKSILED